MAPQVISQIILTIGIITTALGGFASFYYGKIEELDKDRVATQEKNELKTEIVILKSNTTHIKADSSQIKTDTSEIKESVGKLLIRTNSLKKDVWAKLEMKNVPPGVTDYLLLLFTSDKGRITGKIRIKGSQETSTFSTTANDTIPVALRNLWIPDQRQYKVPTIIEYSITEKTDAKAALSIYTQGYINYRGAEPHRAVKERN